MFYHRTCDGNGFHSNGSSISQGILIQMLPGESSTGMLIRLRVGKRICVSRQFENTSKMCNALNDKEMRDYFLSFEIISCRNDNLLIRIIFMLYFIIT